ncbi:MFS transporter [Alicyclobacillus acidoterrestris]|uniref:MFS transporter n=1 Tax=Alicyclobacillus suci TaxID=2816080 RepID=UPI0011949650|nr:MFS transporter [Alicyclobacillus suci]GEO27672.1 MFS transporter [Alicyclobacillus acidoterrestris]
MSDERVNVSRLIDETPFTAYQVITVIIGFLLLALDGYDAQVISFVAPELEKVWGTSSAALAPIFSSSLVGLAIGALISGPIADKIGRKTTVIIAVFLFGIFSILTTTSSGLGALLFWRLVTGFGLGGCMGNVTALLAEYAPTRIRKTVLSIMWCGFPFGATIGGVISAKMIPAFGWKSVFFLGGIAPIVLGFIAVFGMPESIRFLVLHGRNRNRIVTPLNRIAGSGSVSNHNDFYLPEEKLPGFPVKHLFTEGRALNTILVWIVFFMTLLLIYFLTNWMPTLLKGVGFPMGKAIIATAMLQGGGIVGTIVLGSTSDRRNPKVILGISSVIAAILLIVLGYMHTIGALIAVLFFAGFFIVGVQSNMNAIAASVYPTSARSTGASWALGVGRIGSIVGPLIGGVLVAANWSLPNILMLAALAAIIAAIGLALISRNLIDSRIASSEQVVVEN